MAGRKKRKPVIGITAAPLLSPEYARAVEISGGLPVILPPIELAAASGYLEIIDGLLIPGGDDIMPSFYGETERFPLKKVPFERSRFEAELIKRAQRKIPVLAICYGMQLVNVALGGALYQDLSEFEGKNTVDHKGGGHEVFFTDAVGHPLLDRICRGAGGAGVVVNTSHHQAVREPLAPGLRAFARSADGLVEGFFLEGQRFFVGLQWHPERQMESGFSRLLFSSFLREANGKR